MRYWKRVYRIEFPTLNITIENDLRIAFNSVKDGLKESNKHIVKIWNLSDATRSVIQVADLEVKVYAGYEQAGGVVLMMTGTVAEAKTTNDGTDDITELRLKDGGVPLRDTYLSLSYAPNTPGKTITDRIAGEMGLTTEYGTDIEFSVFETGYSYCGLAVDALDAICYGSGVEWSIQNSVVQFHMSGLEAQERGVVLSAGTGMINSPERIIRAQKKPAIENPVRRRRRSQKKIKPQHHSGWKVKALLQPGVQPNDKIRVESEIMTGWFTVEGITHKGDTHSDEWFSEIYLIFLEEPAESNTVEDTTTTTDEGSTS